MAKKITVEMYRGDYKSYPVKVPIAKYSPSGKLFLGAKLQDNLNTYNVTDSNALFVVSTSTATSTDANYAYYTLELTYATTADKTPGTYVGEVQYVVGGKPTTYSPQFVFKLLADVVQEIV